jgi:alpha-mannosidase
MLYPKTEKRVAMYRTLLEQRRFLPLPVPMAWQTAQSEERNETTRGTWKTIASFPFSFGTPHQDTWLRTTVTLPDQDGLYLSIPLGTDALCMIDGQPWCNVNPFHTIINVEKWKGSTIQVTLCAWDGYRFPGFHPVRGEKVLTTLDTMQKDYPILLGKPELMKKLPASYELFYDISALADTYLSQPEESLLRQQGMSRLHDALMSLHLGETDPDVWEQEAFLALQETKQLLSAKNGTIAPTVWAIGGAHIDHAWLWPKSETIRKATRTISGMTSLMEEYPEFVFLSTQPAQMEQVFSAYPSLYQRVKAAFDRGQWEPNGVGLIESDNILATGEGLIRNLLLGRQATERMFPGYRGDTYFLPDSFGYNGNLPQILNGCGVTYFVTSKLSWNDTNRFPYDTFLWKGIDGTVIKAHMIPGGYNGRNTPTEIISLWGNVRTKENQTSLCHTVGEGDGGGGTRRDDIELLRRLGDLQGCPKGAWSTLSAALKDVFARSRNLPVYQGELYFELHRGTYTSQARMKQGYRRTTTLLHNAEYLLAEAWARQTISPKDREACRAILHDLWKETAINQFHDILPGSSVTAVYQETNAFYEKAGEQLGDIITRLATPGELLRNLCPFPSQGIAPYATGTSKSAFSPDGLSLPWGSIRFATDGTITSLVFHGRELVERGGAWNTLLLGEDYPMDWDAWDVDKDSMERLSPVSVPMEPVLVRKGKIGKASFLTQKIRIHTECARIDFQTTVDWHEAHQMLKADFPIALSAENALFDIPFGFVTRSTAENNSIQAAQFEEPAQKFVMVQDTDLSVALMSDSQYGYRAKDGHLAISLLRSPKAPDPTADMGEHTFTYAVMVTDGGLEDVMANAEALNNPPIAVESPQKPLIIPSSGLVVETVKIAEDGDGIIFRVREPYGRPISGSLSFDPSLDPSTLHETNMLEEPEGDGNLSFHPFQVKTFRIRLSR